ncbi:sulfurtransferase complex subunit TusC [Thalassotalea ganghwensis]
MPAKKKQFAILNTQAPFSTAHAKEALDVSLILGSYEQSTNLFFQGDGVYQLLEKQSPESINSKNFLKTFSAFEFYDIEMIYVCEQSLIERNLNANFHIDDAQVVSAAKFSELLHQQEVVFTF